MANSGDDALKRMGLRFRPAADGDLAGLSAALGRRVALPTRLADDGGMVAGGKGRITDILLPATPVTDPSEAVTAWHWVLQNGRLVPNDRLVAISADDADFSFASRFSAEWALHLDSLGAEAMRSRLFALITRLDGIPEFRSQPGDPLFAMHINAPSSAKPKIHGAGRDEVHRLARFVLKTVPDDRLPVALVVTGSGLVMLELRGHGTVRFFSPVVADRHRSSPRTAPRPFATAPAADVPARTAAPEAEDRDRNTGRASTPAGSFGVLDPPQEPFAA